MSLEAHGLCKRYLTHRGPVDALVDAQVSLEKGQGLGAVGPSGSGKSTLLALLIGLLTPDAGRVSLDGLTVSRDNRRDFRRSVQFIPQDPASSLDPRRTIRAQVREPLLRLGVSGDHDAMVDDALERVGLARQLARARPDGLSGGQAQRAAVARAIVAKPRFLLSDEPVSGLDAPLRLQVLNLLAELRDQGLGVLLVTHDLPSLNRVCTDMVVLSEGHIIERGRVSRLLRSPQHQITRRLIDAVPRLLA